MNTKSLTATMMLLAACLTSSLVFAERPDNLQPLPEPPAPPRGVASGEAVPLGEPEISIVRRGNNIVREYRLNGHLYAVKITPDGGRPYFLIDADGDGYMEGQFFDNNDNRVMVPMWVLHRW